MTKIGERETHAAGEEEMLFVEVGYVCFSKDVSYT